jgi:hypothetical protein
MAKFVQPFFSNLLIAEADEILPTGNADNPADHTPFAPQGDNYIGTGTRGLESPLDSRRLLELFATERNEILTLQRFQSQPRVKV